MTYTVTLFVPIRQKRECRALVDSISELRGCGELEMLLPYRGFYDHTAPVPLYVPAF